MIEFFFFKVWFECKIFCDNLMSQVLRVCHEKVQLSISFCSWLQFTTLCSVIWYPFPSCCWWLIVSGSTAIDRCSAHKQSCHYGTWIWLHTLIVCCRIVCLCVDFWLKYYWILKRGIQVWGITHLIYVVMWKATKSIVLCLCLCPEVKILIVDTRCVFLLKYVKSSDVYHKLDITGFMLHPCHCMQSRQ